VCLSNHDLCTLSHDSRTLSGARVDIGSLQTQVAKDPISCKYGLINLVKAGPQLVTEMETLAT